MEHVELFYWPEVEALAAVVLLPADLGTLR